MTERKGSNTVIDTAIAQVRFMDAADHVKIGPDGTIMAYSGSFKNAPRWAQNQMLDNVFGDQPTDAVVSKKGSSRKVGAGLGLAAGVTGLALVGAPATPAYAAERPVKIERGGESVVKAGCVLESDVIVEGTPAMNSDALRGTLVVYNRDAQTYAPYGASGLCGDTAEEVNAIIKKLHKHQIDAGCTDKKGCMGVDIQYVGDAPFQPIEATGTCTDDFHMENGQTLHLPKGTVGKGDVTVNGEKLYDEGEGSENTGLVFVLNSEGDVYAEWGANIQIIKDCHEKAGEFRGNIIKRFQRELLETGCTFDKTGKPCTDVKVRYAPSAQSSLQRTIDAINARSQSWNSRVSRAA